MFKNTKFTSRIRHITFSALIAAIYVVLTLVSNAVGLAFGPIQFRLSEALCVLAIFMPCAIPGLTLGCVIANLFSPLGPGMIADLIFGSIATLIGAWGAWALRKHPMLAPLPTVLANTLIVPFILSYAYGAPDSIPFLMLTVGLGEVGAAWGGGILLYRSAGKLLARIAGAGARETEEHRAL